MLDEPRRLSTSHNSSGSGHSASSSSSSTPSSTAGAGTSASGSGSRSRSGSTSSLHFLLGPNAKGSTFGGWAYDASAEMDQMDLDYDGDAMGEDGYGSGHGKGELVWQASQTPCDALNRLLVDANNEQSPSRDFIPAKPWTPSTGRNPAVLSPSTSASTSKSMSTVETPIRRPSNKRPPRRTVCSPSEEARRLRPKSTLKLNSPNGGGDKAPMTGAESELLAKIRLVSKQVDATTAQRVRAVEKARSVKKAHLQGGHGKKKHGVSSSSSRQGETSSRPTGGASVNGIAVGLARSQSFPAALANGIDAASVLARIPEKKPSGMDVDAKRMPPPTNIPPRRTWSGTGLANEHDPGYQFSDRLMKSKSKAEHPEQTHRLPTPALPSNEALAQMGHSESAAGSSQELPIDLTDDSETRPNHGKEEAKKPKSSSLISRGEDVPQSMNSRKESPALRSLFPLESSVLTPVPAPASKVKEDHSPPLKNSAASKPPLHPVYNPPPRSQGPPALGMRRALISSQSPANGVSKSSILASRSSSIGLPTKQKKFSPPLAKNRPPTSIPSQSAQVISAPRVSKQEERAAIVARVRTPQASNPPCASKEKSEFQGQKAFQSAKVERSRSSSPPAGADDSFTSADFDMGIDAEELERACSKYD